MTDKTTLTVHTKFVQSIVSNLVEISRDLNKLEPSDEEGILTVVNITKNVNNIIREFTTLL